MLKCLLGAVLGLLILPMTLNLSSALASDYKPTVNEGGMYTQTWFLESFLELKDDQAEAAAEGKRFAIVWEQEGCPYCREMHVTNFADDKIRNYVKDNFVVLQLDIWGSRRVTDFDGEELSEKELARKHRVRFTPTIQFFGVPGETSPDGKDEIARMPGYLKPFPFYTMFEYVRSEAYKSGDFRAYYKAAALQAEAEGAASN